jgi:isopenicillin N synthase-like dioxygenase
LKQWERTSRKRLSTTVSSENDTDEIDLFLLKEESGFEVSKEESKIIWAPSTWLDVGPTPSLFRIFAADTGFVPNHYSDNEMSEKTR